MTVPVPKGEGYVLLQYEDTQPRIIGRNITLATLALMLIATIVTGIKYRRLF